jgi:hypothetical protein
MDNTRAQSFQGDKKLPLKSPLSKAERRLIDYWVPRFPRSIEGYHLTLTTILWSAGLILSGYLARHNLHWFAFTVLFLQIVPGRASKVRKTLTRAIDQRSPCSGEQE